MNNRGLVPRRPPKYDKSKVIAQWGDTRDPKADDRRVFATNFSENINIDHLVNFFGGKGAVEGVTLHAYHAFVQLKTPRDFTRALTRDSEQFLGKCIRVRVYDRKDNRKDTSKGKSTPTDIPFRKRARTRSRSRSASRDRSLSPSTNNLQQRPQPGPQCWGGTDPDPFIEQQNRLGYANAFVNYDMYKRKAIEQMVQQNYPSQPGPSATVPFSGNLPSDIELTLKLVLEHRTVRSLSEIQIQNVISFLEREKIEMKVDGSIPTGQTSRLMRCSEPTNYRQMPVNAAQLNNEWQQQQQVPEVKQPSEPMEDTDEYAAAPEGIDDALRLVMNAIQQ